MRTIKRNIVGAFIFSKDDKLLLGKSTRATYDGMWIVPGGGIEHEESKMDAIKREVLEETGLVINDDQISEMDIQLTGSSEKVLKETGERVLGQYTFYNFVIRLGDIADEVAVNGQDDFTEATWWSIEELSSIPLSPPTKDSLIHMGLLL